METKQAQPSDGSLPQTEGCAEKPSAPVLLPGIHSPSDLKALPEDKIPDLCREIRSELLNIVTENGGHLASNLGVVELSVAMHRVFDCPRDHFIFDVGHQSYVHKMLTGRYERMHTLRRGGGISGFTKRTESEYDCFGAGHSSTSLSAALGFAQADRMKGSKAWTLAVVGDGAFTGGMIHEALNNISRGLRLIIIINENEMSISKNIGRFATHMARLRQKEGYFRTKRRTSHIIRKIPLIGSPLFRAIRWVKKIFKDAMYGSNYFEDMGLHYLGPADGNDYRAVVNLLQEAREIGDCVVIHLKTKKGKGYPPAERNPSAFHGMPPASSRPQKPEAETPENFSRHLGQVLIRESAQDDRICAITAAMSEGTGLEAFRSVRPDRFFDVGIAEEHALTFAAGLAADGFRPVAAIYSTFLQRGYDQIVHDIALQRLPVVICIDRAGLSQGDGATHHGIFDVSFLSAIPNVTLYAPATFDGLETAFRTAVASGLPSAIRYPNRREDARVRAVFYPNGAPQTVGVRTSYAPGQSVDAVVLCHGAMVSEAISAADLLAADGITLGILLCEYLKPYDRLAEEVSVCLPPDTPLLFAEEEIRAGGFGMMLADALFRLGVLGTGCGTQGHRFDILAVEDNFVLQTAPEPVRRTAGVDAAGIAARVRQLLR
jgi:1-deoxy-D-xylulose-5-phosphate synthase